MVSSLACLGPATDQNKESQQLTAIHLQSLIASVSGDTPIERSDWLVISALNVFTKRKTGALMQVQVGREKGSKKIG